MVESREETFLATPDSQSLKIVQYYIDEETLRNPFGREYTYDFDDFTHFSDKTGQWMKSKYSFSALKLSM